jgi:hypothetical protein
MTAVFQQRARLPLGDDFTSSLIARLGRGQETKAGHATVRNQERLASFDCTDGGAPLKRRLAAVAFSRSSNMLSLGKVSIISSLCQRTNPLRSAASSSPARTCNVLYLLACFSGGMDWNDVCLRDSHGLY